MQISIKVPDMSCNHCKMTIENAVNALDNVKQVQVDLDSKIVTVSGEAESDAVVNAIQDSGYTVENMTKIS